jgi:hypothetical protein
MGNSYGATERLGYWLLIDRLATVVAFPKRLKLRMMSSSVGQFLRPREYRKHEAQKSHAN